MAEQNSVQLATGVGATDVLVIIVYLVIIILAAYFLTKYIAKRSLRKGMRNAPGKQRGKASKAEFGHMVSVADRIAVDRDKTIMVLEFHGKYYLMSTSADRIECIDKVEVTTEAEEQYSNPPDAMATEAKEMSDEVPAPVTQAVQRADDEDTFFKRFKKCIMIVLKSYLPKSARQSRDTESFDRQLKDQMGKGSKEKKDDKG